MSKRTVSIKFSKDPESQALAGDMIRAMRDGAAERKRVASTDRGHTCHAAGCNLVVPPKLLMCYAHWKRLPKPAQRVIWYYYRAGQEVDKRPSAAYLLAQACAVAIVAFKEKRWGSLQALNHVGAASRNAQQRGLELTRIEEIVRAMGCETLTR